MINKKPLISVIMPSYNVEQYVGLAIESVLKQTYANFEFLIWDDGSTDQTYNIIQSYCDPRIKVFKNEINEGNLITTNLLLEACLGEYVALQDADDVSDDKRLEALLRKFQINPKLILVGSFYNLIDGEGKIYQCGFLPFENDQIKKEMEKEVIPILYPSIMFKLEGYKKCGGFNYFFNRKGYADFDWMARLSLFGEVQNSRLPLYSYRKHSFSFTAVNKKNSVKGIFKYMHFLLCEAHKDRLKAKFDFFETNNVSEMKKRISNYLLLKAKINFWDRKNNIFPYLWKSIIFNPMNVDSYRTLLFMIRKRK